jgi:N-acetylglucosaminyl-diphospho-decaprenol L-rhamnosyltransferase
MKLLVVIVNYRVAHLTIDCLSSIGAELWRVPGTQVAVCENGSGDDSEKQIRSAIADNAWNSWCSLTANTTNLGFAGGNNVILGAALQSESPPRYVLLLNPDTIVRPNALERLTDFMDKHPNVGVAGSRLEDPDGTPQRSAFRFPTPLNEFESNIKFGLVSRLFRRWVVAPPVSDHECATDWVAGASMMIRREALLDVGLLDEGYFTYFEDVDFCFNAQRAGWPTWYVPSSRVVHLVGQSSGIKNKAPGRRPSYLFEARRRYFLKNRGPFKAAWADIGQILGLASWRLRVLLGKSDSTPPHYLRDCIRHSVFVAGFKLKNTPNSTALAPPRRAQENTCPGN